MKTDSIFRRMSEQLKIPSEVMLRDGVLRMIGNRLVVLENFRCIRRLEAKQMEITFCNYSLLIQGQDLYVQEYNDDEMVICGRIESVSVCGMKR